MKRLSIILSLLTTLVISSCDNQPAVDCVQVKIIDQICGNAIFQVIGGAVPDDVANTWTDSSGTTYENVFTTMVSPCDSGVQIGDILFVKIVDQRPASDCLVCAAMLADTPKPFLHTVISKECEVGGDDF